MAVVLKMLGVFVKYFVSSVVGFVVFALVLECTIIVVCSDGHGPLKELWVAFPIGLFSLYNGGRAGAVCASVLHNKTRWGNSSVKNQVPSNL